MIKKNKIVIKVGTSTVNKLGQEKIVEFVSKIYIQGNCIALVSSGAVAFGRKVLNENNKKTSKKLLASVGQIGFFNKYQELFLEKRIISAQFLVRKLNFTETLKEAIQNNLVALVNGNDALSGEDLLYDDNDSLSGDVAKAINSGVLVIISDIDGVYDKNLREHKDAKKNKILHSISGELLENSKDTGSVGGTGGMYTKLLTAQKMIKVGIATYITNSLEDAENFINNYKKNDKWKEYKGTLITNNL